MMKRKKYTEGAAPAARIEKRFLRPAVILLIAALITAASAVQLVSFGEETPKVTAKGAVVYCENTDETVWSKGGSTKLAPYSITKLMTALLAVQNLPLDQKVTVSAKAAAQKGTSMHLKAGEQLTVEELLYGMLMVSGNDAAWSLSEAVSGKGQTKAFVRLMNRTAKNIACRHTHFANPSGLPNEKNYTTADDFLQIARVAYSNATIRKIAGTRSCQISPTNKSGARKLTNTAVLLHTPGSGVYASKNGYQSDTDCSAALAYEKDGLNLYAVVLGDTKADRKQDLQTMIDYAKSHVHGTMAVKKGHCVGKVHVRHGAKTSVNAYIAENGYAYLPKEGSSKLVTTKTDLRSGVKAPLHSGDRVGTYRIYVSGEQVNSVPIVVKEDVATGWLPSYLGISNAVTAVILVIVVILAVGALWIASVRARSRRRRKLARKRKIERLARERLKEEEERSRRGWGF